MRKVEYSEWRKLPGDTHHTKVLAGFGDFHQFGCNYEEFENGAGNFTTAIIELPDGTMVNQPVEMVKFLDKG